MHRYTYNSLHNAFLGYFTNKADIFTHCLRNKSNKFMIEFSRTNMRKFSIASAGPRIWNNLPYELRHIPNLYLFKKHLLAYLS